MGVFGYETDLRGRHSDRFPLKETAELILRYNFLEGLSCTLLTLQLESPWSKFSANEEGQNIRFSCLMNETALRYDTIEKSVKIMVDYVNSLDTRMKVKIN